MDDSLIGDTTYLDNYDGLVDTTTGFSGPSTTYGPSPITGSGLPLVDNGPPIPFDPLTGTDLSGGFSQDSSLYTTADGINDTSISSSIQAANALSGVADPSFQASPHTPAAVAASPAGDQMNAFSALSKFGSSVASLFGNHPQTISPASGAAARTGLAGSAAAPVASGTQMILVLVVVVALGLLLVRAKGD